MWHCVAPLLLCIFVLPACDREKSTTTMSNDFALYDRLQDSIYARVDEQFDTLTEAEKTFFFIDWLNMQVHNGGWHQWYHNWPANERRQRIDQTIDALQEIGAIDTILLLQRAVERLDAGGAPDDEMLGELNEDLWDQPDDLTSLTQDWADDRLDQFAAAP